MLAAACAVAPLMVAISNATSSETKIRAAAASAPASVSSAVVGERPDLFLIVIDALRPDRLGCYGAGRGVSHAIDAVAAQGVVYRNAFAVTSWTKPSIPSLLTSLYPSRHGVFEGVYQNDAGETLTDLVADSLVTVAEALRDADYETAAFVRNAHLLARWGFDQGFVHYDEDAGDARAIVDSCLAWFDSASGRPRFAYLHFLDAHWPYRPLDEHRRRFATNPIADSLVGGDWKAMRDAINEGRMTPTAEQRKALLDLYDACIYGIDVEIARLVAALEARGAWDGALVVITADHGEEFMEHSQFGHGETLYDECLRIPLIVKPPVRASGNAATHGRSADAASRASSTGSDPVSTLDIAPTLVAAAGVDLPVTFEGRPLSVIAPFARDAASAAALAPLFAEVKHKWAYAVAAREGGWKYVATYAFDQHPRNPEMAKYLAAGTWVELELEEEDGGLETDEIKLLGTGAGKRAKVTGQIEALVRRPRAEHRLAATGGDASASSDGGTRAGTAIGEDLPPAALKILGHLFPVEAEARIEWEPEGAGIAGAAALSPGLWVDAKGDIEKGVFIVEKIEVKASEGIEVRGPIESMEKSASGDFHVQILGLTMEVPADAAVEFEGEAAEASLGDRAASDPPATRSRPSVAALFSQHPWDRTEELYDLRPDPGEATNVAATNPQVLASLRGRVEAWLAARGIGVTRMAREAATQSSSGDSTAAAPLDAETIEKLRALGYIR